MREKIMTAGLGKMFLEKNFYALKQWMFFLLDDLNVGKSDAILWISNNKITRITELAIINC